MNNDNLEQEFQRWKEYKLQSLKYHRAICMLICGSSLEDVAKTFGTSKKTIERFFNNPEFNHNLEKAIRITFQSSLSKAAIYADKALDILIEISQDTNQPTRFRLQAISQIFDVSFRAKLHESEKDEKSDAEKKLITQQRLLSFYRTTQDLSKEVSSQALPSGKLNIDAQKSIWMELYPDEPFPSEEEYRQWFVENELGESEN